ncbi:Arrestin_N domain-containing protein [Meloidogyne graminicola]|uniref:Arrestin_N domain-containing protein n=1 Tax=Meloidogyne graminicola TaxID=189291 RepID=A0A8S9ZL08_9BILA|nr:Arrestin_N domain-containing protein [Meloidogyne graminicola]
MSIIGGKRSLSKTRESSIIETTRLLDRFEIVLDNPEEVYFSGQEITGKVIIECSEPKQLNEVLLEVKGRARSYWTQSRKTCSANEAYFCEQFNTTYTHKLPKNYEENIKKLSLCEDKKLLNELQRRPTAKTSSSSTKTDPKKLFYFCNGRTLPPGVHQIPFSYTLPKHLPSSFEGDYGFVRYTCRAICERPWDFDIVCFRAFTVIGIEDLNHEAEV